MPITLGGTKGTKCEKCKHNPENARLIRKDYGQTFANLLDLLGGHLKHCAECMKVPGIGFEAVEHGNE
jgi:hypothetical protein